MLTEFGRNMFMLVAVGRRKGLSVEHVTTLVLSTTNVIGLESEVND
jgi:hypothetical protein